MNILTQIPDMEKSKKETALGNLEKRALLQ